MIDDTWRVVEEGEWKGGKWQLLKPTTNYHWWLHYTAEAEAYAEDARRYFDARGNKPLPWKR